MICQQNRIHFRSKSTQFHFNGILFVASYFLLLFCVFDLPFSSWIVTVVIVQGDIEILDCQLHAIMAVIYVLGTVTMNLDVIKYSAHQTTNAEHGHCTARSLLFSKFIDDWQASRHGMQLNYFQFGFWIRIRKDFSLCIYLYWHTVLPNRTHIVGRSTIAIEYVQSKIKREKCTVMNFSTKILNPFNK